MMIPIKMGLVDEWEVEHFGSVSATSGGVDADGDGYTNPAEEQDGGTDPTDPLSNLTPPDLVWTGAVGDGDFFNEANWDGDAATSGTQPPKANSLKPYAPVQASSLTVDGAVFEEQTGADRSGFGSTLSQ